MDFLSVKRLAKIIGKPKSELNGLNVVLAGVSGKHVATVEKPTLKAKLNQYGFIRISKDLFAALGWAKDTDIELTVEVADGKVTFGV